MIDKIINFDNIKIEYGMNTPEQITSLVETLITIINGGVEGDVVEFGCYVGESSKYLMKTINELNSNKKLYLFDSFEGLPDLSKWEENTGWTPRTLRTSEDILIQNFKQNSLPLPIIHKDWFKNIPEYKIPEKISFAFLDGDFYDSIYDSLCKIYDKVSDNGVIFFHDYLRNDLPGVEAAIRDFFKERGVEYNVTEVTNQLGMFVKTSNLIDNTTPTIISPQKNSQITTIVTGLWDIGRESLTNDWSRSYKHYLDKFDELLKTDNNLIIFGDENLQKFVSERRDNSNTQFIIRNDDWFKDNDYYAKIQTIRNNVEWYNQVGWLQESTQARLEMYNPLVMSKMFLLNDAKIMDKFNSDYLFWLDAGITNTVHPGYFTHDKVLNKLSNHINKFTFLAFPYDAETEVHGFKYDELNKFANNKVKLVGRGGFFGGPKELIGGVNGLYYTLLTETLNNNLMGTEESLFSILLYKYPEIFNYFELEDNGLTNRFFENLKNDSLVVKKTIESIGSSISNSSVNTAQFNTNYTSLDKVGLYVIGFNSPKQLETLIISMLEYDKNFIEKPRKILLDNSSDLSTTPIYSELCSKYGFEHIKKDNLGICGGRQWIAEHFEKSDLEFMYFFEDDMFFYPKKGEVCRNGFNRMVDNLYDKTIMIAKQENFDFLKLNFSEFFGDNSTQWTWYNVPQVVREQYWPNYSKLPEIGTDPNAPKVKYDNVKIYEGLPYVTGEIYYCNWPQLVSKSGSKKMFLETTWAHPYEQTWMSHMYQELKKDKLKFGLLLLTPTEHNRFDHYERELRKES